MADVSESLTRQVADLAKLELSDEQARQFTAQLGEIIRYVDLLQKVDVSKVEPMTHPFDLTAPLREDKVIPSPVNSEGKPKVIDCGPDVLNDAYKVPPIL
jgi:aspartyl-tRNA(Asn)/glutamyl-tRNA(Gln) amidotransferase subunit C